MIENNKNKFEIGQLVSFTDRGIQYRMPVTGIVNKPKKQPVYLISNGIFRFTAVESRLTA